MASSSIIELLQKTTRSPAFKFIVVSFLLLALTIPLLFVALLNAERHQYARSAQYHVGSMWGSQQTVRGPFIVVPTITKKEIKIGDKTTIEEQRHHAVFLPETLDVKSDIQTEIRERGIFSIPVYKSSINVSGSFLAPETTRIKRAVDEIIWSEAVMVVLIDDVTAIKKTAVLSIDNDHKQQFRASTGTTPDYTTGIHAPVSVEHAQGSFNFSFQLHLNGSSSIKFVPAGGETTNVMKSDWPHPSFTGTFLPEKRSISNKGFEATWVIPRLARGQTQTFLTGNILSTLNDKAFGVNFYQPVGFYNLVERSLKYAMGFIAIAFFTVFIMEVQSRKRVHWIQYIFVGLALIIFYLVLLGLSEHLGFEVAYAASSLATATLTGSYVTSALKSKRHGLAIFGIMAVIYGLLYLLLRVEDYAMLIGSIAAFSLLAIVMFSTRNIDWSGVKEETEGEIV